MNLRVLEWCFRTAGDMALKINISQVAVAMHALAEAVREVHVRLSIDDMLVLSEKAAAGRTGSSVQVWCLTSSQCRFFGGCAGMPGGLLFESFLVTAGRRTSQRAMLALAKTCRDEKRECTAAEAAKLLAAERVGFCFNTLSMLANRGRSANRQLFFMTLLAQSKGLSRTGMDVFSAMNACISPRTFDLELKTFLCVVALRERSASFNINAIRSRRAQICLFSAGAFWLACTCSG